MYGRSNTNIQNNMATSLLPMVSQKLSPRKQLSFLRKHFTKGSFENLSGIVQSSLKRQTNGNLSIMAEDVGKCVSTISYFFNDAVWDISSVRQAIREHLLRSPATRITGSDMAAFDESPISKHGTSFQFIGDTWDNAEKNVNDGYTLLTCAIVSLRNGTRFIHDEICFSNKDPKWRGVYPYLERLLRRLFETTSVSLVVFDSGFRNQYLIRYVLDMGRNFILRLTLNMVIWDGTGKKRCLVRNIGSMDGACTETFSVHGQEGWRISWYSGRVNAWTRRVKEPLTVIAVTRPSFHEPMILCTNLPVTDFKEALDAYEKYLNRWKIEILFQDIKQLGLESFRVRSKRAIMKYLTIIILVHSLLTIMTRWVSMTPVFSSAVIRYLRKKRKIRFLSFRGMKIFYELLLEGRLRLREVLKMAETQEKPLVAE